MTRVRERDEKAGETASSPRLSHIRVVVVDDHEVVQEGVVALLERQGGMVIVGRASSGAEALHVIRQVRPDVVILDMALPDMSGLDVLHELAPLETAVVLFTAGARSDEMIEALRLGVRGVVLKEMPSRLLVECVRKVARGGEWIEKNSVSSIISRLMASAEATRGEMSRLTHREIEVVRLVCRGKRNTEVGEELHLSTSTVKMHLHNIYQKLDVRSRTELIIWARENGCCP